MRIPDDILEQFDEETSGLVYGSATLTVHFNLKTGAPRWVIGREKSYFSDDADRKKSGRGHTDEEQLNKVKELMRMRHPKGVKVSDIAEYLECRYDRAARLIDVLSNGTDFLVSMDDERPPTFYISKDAERDKMSAKA